MKDGGVTLLCSAEMFFLGRWQVLQYESTLDFGARCVCDQHGIGLLVSLWRVFANSGSEPQSACSTLPCHLFDL